jgi:Glycosyl transferase family 11
MTVVSRHIGRLGNNLFQVATSIGYAKKYNYQWGVDPGSGLGEPYSSIHKVFPDLPKSPPHGIRYHEHNNEYCYTHGVHKDVCHFDYHPIPDIGHNVTLTGFFQSYKYFEGHDEEIKKVFALPKIEGYMDYVSIHVRRGDYVQHAGSFPPVDEKYLAAAIGRIYREIYRNYFHDWNQKFMIFSDDIPYCKELLKNYVSGKYEFSEGRTELEDLALMASCGHHIIANSTFSWWAAYLGHNPNRIVITPSKETWFGSQSGVKKPVVDLLPDNWIQIHTR